LKEETNPQQQQQQVYSWAIGKPPSIVKKPLEKERRGGGRLFNLCEGNGYAPYGLHQPIITWVNIEASPPPHSIPSVLLLSMMVGGTRQILPAAAGCRLNGVC
jgi:hypothetical protein